MRLQQGRKRYDHVLPDKLRCVPHKHLHAGRENYPRTPQGPSRSTTLVKVELRFKGYLLSHDYNRSVVPHLSRQARSCIRTACHRTQHSAMSTSVDQLPNSGEIKEAIATNSPLLCVAWINNRAGKMSSPDDNGDDSELFTATCCVRHES